MTNLTQISIVSTAENAVKKLQKAKIAVYNCKKQGALFLFSVKDKDIKKVFAIFSKPCYNINVERGSVKKRLFKNLALRAGLAAGMLVFAVAAFISDYFVLKIEVGGSGAYLASVVKEIVAEEGAGEWKPFSSLDKPVATGRILALPQVTFCNISKRGSVLLVDVEVDQSHSMTAERKPLVSDCNGKVVNLVAICGTAAVSEGDFVSSGDTLIYANGGIVVGYAEIECKKTAEYIALDDSEKSIKEACASLLLEGDEILSISHSAEPAEGGVRIIMDITFLHKISINLT